MSADERPIGTVVRYDPQVHAALVHVDQDHLARGDVIHVVGPHTDQRQRVSSIRRSDRIVLEARAGDDVGIALRERAESGDIVFRTTAPNDTPTAKALDAIFR